MLSLQVRALVVYALARDALNERMSPDPESGEVTASTVVLTAVFVILCIGVGAIITTKVRGKTNRINLDAPPN